MIQIGGLIVTTTKLTNWAACNFILFLYLLLEKHFNGTVLWYTTLVLKRIHHWIIYRCSSCSCGTRDCPTYYSVCVPRRRR